MRNSSVSLLSRSVSTWTSLLNKNSSMNRSYFCIWTRTRFSPGFRINGSKMAFNWSETSCPCRSKSTRFGRSAEENRSFFSIWEKFFAGCEYIFVFLIVQILHHCRAKLLTFYSKNEITQFLSELKVSGDRWAERNVCTRLAFRSTIRPVANILSSRRSLPGRSKVIPNWSCQWSIINRPNWSSPVDCPELVERQLSFFSHSLRINEKD